MFCPVPPPSINFRSEGAPVNNQPYTSSCVAQFVAAVPSSMVTIEWMNEDGVPLTEVSSGVRITVAPIRQIDDRTYARDVTLNPLRTEDSGTYTCEAAIMAQFITTEPTSESFEFVVLGKLFFKEYYD